MQQIIFFIVMSFSCLSFAESLDYNLAVRYLEVSKIEEMFDSEIDTFVDQLSGKNPEKQAEIRNFFKSSIGWDVLKIPITRLIQQAFTKKEIEKIIKFYETPEGKAYADKSIWIGNELSKIIASNISNVMGLNNTPK